MSKKEPLLPTAHTRLTQAVQANQSHVIFSLVKQAGKGILEKRDANKQTPLFLAAWLAHPESLQALIEAGANTKVVDHLGHTPLHYSAAKGDLHCIKMLLEAGCDIHACTPKGENPLYFAAKANRVKAVELLVQRGSTLSQHTDFMGPVSAACVAFDARESLQHLLQSGMDVDVTDAQGQSALLWAVIMNRESCFDLLIQAGADIGLKDKSGGSALSYAKERGYAHMISTLEAITLKNELNAQLTTSQPTQTLRI